MRLMATPPGGARLRPICDSRGSRVLAASVAIALFSFAAAACTSENAAPPDEQELCDLPTASGGGKVLRQLLDTDQVQTTIFAESSDLVERMQERLNKENLGKPTSPTSVCSFSPKGHVGANTLGVEFSWVPSGGDPKKTSRSLIGASHYNLNDVLGESNDIGAGLRVECRLPGKFGTLSKRVLLYAEASNTLNRGRDVDQATKDRQIAFLYFMTRKVTDALGCENDPLKKEPVAKPYATASEASRATA